MLNYCDIYPLELPARYANRYACYDTVYIVSNWELSKQYSELQKEDIESWKAFLRRISEIREYKGINNIMIYKSVEDYFNRETDFVKIVNMDEVPFNDWSGV